MTGKPSPLLPPAGVTTAQLPLHEDPSSNSPSPLREMKATFYQASPLQWFKINTARALTGRAANHGNSLP